MYIQLWVGYYDLTWCFPIPRPRLKAKTLFRISFLETKKENKRADRNLQCPLMDVAYVRYAYILLAKAHHIAKVKVNGTDICKGDKILVSNNAVHCNGISS